jgi:hypothetical protein
MRVKLHAMHLPDDCTDIDWTPCEPTALREKSAIEAKPKPIAPPANQARETSQPISMTVTGISAAPFYVSTNTRRRSTALAQRRSR